MYLDVTIPLVVYYIQWTTPSQHLMFKRRVQISDNAGLIASFFLRITKAQVARCCRCQPDSKRTTDDTEPRPYGV